MRPVFPPIYAVFDDLAISICPLCTNAYQPGCSPGCSTFFGRASATRRRDRGGLGPSAAPLGRRRDQELTRRRTTRWLRSPCWQAYALRVTTAKYGGLENHWRQVNFLDHPFYIVKTLSENLSMNLEQRRISPRMGLPK